MNIPNIFTCLRNWWRNFFGSNRRKSTGNGIALNPNASQGPRPSAGGGARPRPFNPFAYSFQQFFSPRQSAEEQVEFRSIQGESLIEKTEEWTRDQNGGLRTTVKRALIVVCSGEVVQSADRIRCRCTVCSGFDSFLAHCAISGCGLALCRLHVFYFAGGQERLPMCETHYRRAVDSIDTWKARDQANGCNSSHE